MPEGASLAISALFWLVQQPYASCTINATELNRVHPNRLTRIKQYDNQFEMSAIPIRNF